MATETGTNTVAPTVLSNNILYRAFAQSSPITPMKLQKLLYFIYRDYFKQTRQQIFAERFEVWKFGPVLPNVYHEFKQYGRHAISSYSKDSNGDSFMIREDSDNALIRVVEDVWTQYKDVNGIFLSKITHQPNSAWYKALQKGKTFLDDEDILNDQANWVGRPETH